MTALTVEQKKVQYARQLAAYTQKQCDAVLRKRQAGTPKVLTKNQRSTPPPDTGSCAGSTDSEEEGNLETPKPEGKSGQLQRYSRSDATTYTAPLPQALGSGSASAKLGDGGDLNSE
ncbi:hypothetical protein R3P38DRAFT_2757175 [Favolaschia claudopus]|uniref:Uncharacterized protein n=1 Tax=Favolaschia claudopus TaxID=2862362 RepID=A0AAW0EGI6_9AGAR